MQRLKYHLHTLRVECEAEQVTAHEAADAANTQNPRERLDQLLRDVQAEPEVDIPAQLHQAGAQTLRLVSARDIAYLHEGKTIARAVRALLPHGAGNQRLTVAHSHGRSVALTFGAQTLSEIGDDATWQTTSAVLIGAGNCDEAARLAFDIARTRDIPSAIVGDHQAGHTFALLHPDSTHPVVVDGWPIFPSSCLLDDSEFQVDRVVAKHHAGDPVSTPLNLPAIDTLRQRLHDQLGEHAIENVMLETLRQRYQLRLSSLDRMLVDQGLLHYHQLKTDRMDASQRALFDVKVEKLKTRMGDAILHQVAHLISTQSSESEPQQRLWQNGIGSAQDMQLASEIARTIASEKAQHLARTDSNKLVIQQARKKPDRSADLELSRSHAHTEMRGLAVVTAESTVTVNARAKPTLWHYLLHGRNKRYQSPGGQFHCVASAPQSLIDAMSQAQATADRLGYPDKHRQRDDALHHRATAKESGISDAELMQHCVARMAEQIAHLRSSTDMPQSAQRAAHEIDLLHEIGERFEDVAPAIQETLLTQVAELLPQLHPDVLAKAVSCWMRWQGGTLPGEFFTQACIALRKSWFNHLADHRVETALRPAVLRCTDIASVIEFAATQLPVQLHCYLTLLQVIDACCVRLPDDAAKTLACQRLAAALDKVDDDVIKQAGQPLLERHRPSFAAAAGSAPQQATSRPVNRPGTLP